MIDKPFVIWHGGCADGFGAAWVLWKFFDGAPDFFAGYYGREPPDVTDRDVIIVDFSYKRPGMEVLIGQARSVLVLDHHKSAAKELAGLPVAAESWKSQRHTLLGPEGHERVAVLFDMDRSGAGLAWDFFYPGHPRPVLIDRIEDRDLWRFNLNGSREIHASLMSHPMEFLVWDRILHLVEETVCRHAMIDEGTGILRKHDKDVAAIIENGRREMMIDGVKVPVVNCPWFMASDVGNILAKGQPFAATYHDFADARGFSLRSEKGSGLDVSVIAERYAGGGHFHAAGFEIPHPVSETAFAFVSS